MKNSIAILLLGVVMASCNTKDSHSKYSYTVNDNGTVKREMIIKNSFSDVEVEMEGTATFNDDASLITKLTPGGYIKYRNRKKELIIGESENKVIMNLVENGKSIPLKSETGKEIVADAIKQIKKLQEKQK